MSYIKGNMADYIRWLESRCTLDGARDRYEHERNVVRTLIPLNFEQRDDCAEEMREEHLSEIANAAWRCGVSGSQMLDSYAYLDSRGHAIPISRICVDSLNVDMNALLAKFGGDAKLYEYVFEGDRASICLAFFKPYSTGEYSECPAKGLVLSQRITIKGIDRYGTSILYS